MEGGEGVGSGAAGCVRVVSRKSDPMSS